MNLYKISVIIPVFNCKQYLDRCLTSLLSQTMQELEIVIVDDGSTDGSLNKLHEYTKYSNVVVLHQENAGAAKARETGIKYATGMYIAFLDSDDWVNKYMYEAMYETIVNTNSDIVQCGYKKTDNDSEEDICFPKSPVREYSSFEALAQLFGTREKSEFNFLLWNKLYRAEILKKVPMPVSLKSNNDVPVIPKVFFYSNKIAVMDEPLVYYFERKNHNNLSISDELRTSKQRFIWSHIKAFKDVSDFFENKDNELHLMSLKYTIEWSLSAVISKECSWECKLYAISVIKDEYIFGNRYIKLKKRAVAAFLKICS